MIQASQVKFKWQSGRTVGPTQQHCQYSPVSVICQAQLLCPINRLYGDHFSQHSAHVGVLIYFLQRRLERYLLVSGLCCLYSFTRGKHKQTKHFIDIRSIQGDPITLSIYVIAVRDELNLKLELFNPACFYQPGFIKLADFLQQQISFQIARARNYTKKEFSAPCYSPTLPIFINPRRWESWPVYIRNSALFAL